MLSVWPDMVEVHRCAELVRAFEREGVYRYQYADQLTAWWDQLKPLTLPLIELFQARLTWLFGQTIWLEGACVARTGPGGKIQPHTDKRDHTPKRDFSSILYLNGWPLFEGGELALPYLGMTISPQIGKVVMFPAIHPYEHEVWPVRSGERYTLTAWYTTDLSSAARLDTRFQS